MTTATAPPKYSTKQVTTAWAMYDWANSAFATSVMTALLPVYYQTVAGGGLPASTATAYWGYTTSLALLITALLAPILGAMGDFRGAKKRYLSYFAALGITGTGLLYFVGQGDWLLASAFFILGNVGFAGANVFYDALLPHIAPPEDLDKLSAKGFALGYLGGGLLLAANLALIYFAPPDQSDQMFRIGFLTVAIWWLVFALPLWLRVPETPPVFHESERGQHPVKVSLRRLVQTFRDIRQMPELFKYMVALWLYTDGIGTIVKMAAIVGAEIGIDQTALIGTVLMVQFVGIPFSFAFGWLAGKIGPKRGIYIGLVIYAFVSLGAYRMQTSLHIFLLGLGIAMAQGGTQALSRSLGARLIPVERSGEFFGFVSVTIKFAGIVGPAVFGIVAQTFGDSRPGFLALLVFFAAGFGLLTRVDVRAGVADAQAVGNEL